MYEKVKATVIKYKMLEPGDKVVVGVSGGPDSVALAHILTRLAKEFGLTIHIGHLNHMFRGKEAELDANSVARLAEKLGLPCTVERIDVPAYLSEHRVSAQAGARYIRYAFFEKLADEVGANRIATGHHADDQAETVLMNFLRGSGVSGLTGIPPVRQGKYIRPLIEVSRQEIENYCRYFDLPVRFDASNAKNIYLRNRVRNQLIPFLQKEFNPKIVQTIARFSEIARDDNEFICREAEKAWQLLGVGERTEEIRFELDRFWEWPRAVQRRILIKAWEAVTGSARDIMYTNIENLLEFLKTGPASGYIELPKGVVAQKTYNSAIITAKYEPAQIEYDHELKVPGRTIIPEAGLTIITDVKQIAAYNMDAKAHGIDKGLKAHAVDYDRLHGDVRVRNRRPGDRFQPLGMKGTKKLKDFFIDLKIPVAERDRYPVITAGDDIVCVGRLRIDERWKITESTRTVLIIKIIDEMDS
ncbi:tRNA(Ile)-lysidine synthetase [Thermincola ferriacetica]|uniref:tRNA(Ile)-lysidine synthase n=1 Tax=Thermincola ferriacetica TaxID=281456 RepID=A0A0L6W020_9FIRM|nr:tRNA lysidine(34) synthetase TilS [Thermincola ferriacetica]KNZ68880.1 tRNA(Ile)-lysidine synthetase [Thermincola ferriacetica]